MYSLAILSMTRPIVQTLNYAAPISHGVSLQPFPGTQHLAGVITHTLNQPSMWCSVPPRGLPV